MLLSQKLWFFVASQKPIKRIINSQKLGNFQNKNNIGYSPDSFIANVIKKENVV